MCDTANLLTLLEVDRLEGAESGVTACVPRSDQRVAILGQMGSLPAAILVFLALLGAAGVAYLLGSSFRRGRRDLAVLRVLGFTRRQCAGTVLVQAGTVGLVGSLAALPVGVALGRTAWRSVVEGMVAVVATPEVSWLGTAGVAAGATVIALLVAVPFAARALSRPAAHWLRAE